MPQGYRTRIKQSTQRMELMSKDNESRRIECAEHIPSPFIPPLVRRRIIVEDYDFGHVRHEITLFRSGRIDSYEVAVDGTMLDKKMGWAAVCQLLQQAFLRVRKL